MFTEACAGERQRGVPLKSGYFTNIGSSIVWKQLQINTNMLLIITSIVTSSWIVSTSMKLNDLEPFKKGVLVFFLQFSGVTHISRVNCAEMARAWTNCVWNFQHIERTFYPSKFRPLKFKESSARRFQIWLGCSFKTHCYFIACCSDCPGGRTAAVARYVSFAQITCFVFEFGDRGWKIHGQSDLEQTDGRMGKNHNATIKTIA